MGGVITMAMLSVLCIAVLVPQALKSREERHQRFLDSLRFQDASVDHLSQPPSPPSSPIPRRRNVFVLLLVAAVVSAIGAVISPSKLSLVVHLAVDDCLLAYVAQLVRWRDARPPSTVPAVVPEPVFRPAAVRPILRAG